MKGTTWMGKKEKLAIRQLIKDIINISGYINNNRIGIRGEY